MLHSSFSFCFIFFSSSTKPSSAHRGVCGRPLCIYISLLFLLGCVADVQVVLCQPGANLIAHPRLHYSRLGGKDVKKFPGVVLINQQQDRRKIPFLWVNRLSKGNFARQLGASVLRQLEWLSQRFGFLAVFPNSFLFTLGPYALIFSFLTVLWPLQHTLSCRHSAGIFCQIVDQSKSY